MLHEGKTVKIHTNSFPSGATLFRRVLRQSALCFILSAALYAADGVSENRKNFVRGNITDKTNAVLNATGEDKTILSLAAIDFAVANKDALGEDKDLTALALAGILSLPQDSANGKSAYSNAALEQKLLSIYSLYTDDTVKIAVLTQMEKRRLAGAELAALLNDYIRKDVSAVAKNALTKTSLAVLGAIGNAESFSILLDRADASSWKAYREELLKSLELIAERCLPNILERINMGTKQECRRIFDVTAGQGGGRQFFKAEIAENVLSRAIYIAENTAPDAPLISLQLDSFRLLADFKWTRGSKTAAAFFETAKNEYERGALDAAGFASVVQGLPEVAPFDSASALSAYLQKMCKEADGAKAAATEPVVLAIISALELIGDKTAFDPLLAVINNYNYSETVVAAARSALAKLKW